MLLCAATLPLVRMLPLNIKKLKPYKNEDLFHPHP